jgi:hypothetical protein
MRPAPQAARAQLAQTLRTGSTRNQAQPASQQFQPGSQQGAAPDGQPQQVAQAASPNGPNMPDQAKMAILIRTMIIALNQANMTNNYSVLRDMAAPSFQEANSPEDLSEIFAALRERDLDLGPITIINPQLFRDPMIDDRGRLRLIGFFPSRPEQVNFDLAFEMVDGEWKLFGIGVNTSREAPAQ